MTDPVSGLTLPFTLPGTLGGGQVIVPPKGTARTIPQQPPLVFTKNLAGALQSKVIGAFGTPLPASDPMSAYRYLNSRRQTLIDSARQRPLIRLQDKNLSQLATIGQEMSCVTEEIAADSGGATVVIRGGDYLADFVRNAVRIEEDLHLSVDPIATQPTWKTRWGGKITNIGIKRDSNGIHTVELTAISNREHLKNILIGSTPLFPPEVQPIKMWMLPANCRTACAVTLFIQLLRAFDPIASIPTNLFNPAGWINPLGPDAILNLLPTFWPIQVQFVNPLFDQSRTTVLTSAWQDFHSSTIDIMKDAGVMARAYTYFTDDEDNPHPELEAIVGDDLANFARPQRNAVVVAFEDHSGYSGPTGTALDGVINLFSSTLDDLITETVFPIDSNNDGEVDPVFRKIFGVAPPPPWAMYRDGQESGIIESGYFQHKAPVKTTMTGGKSPKLVNDLQCVSGDTIVEGPDGDNRIDVLAAEGKPFRVWSVTPEGFRVGATATHAFRKGAAELFEYMLEDGRSIKATYQHRFLTEQGFIHGADISVGDEVATVVHDDLPPEFYTPVRQVQDVEYKGITETAAVTFRKVVGIESVGVGDFYDMTVPGWENYSANGFWNHNTFGIRYAISQIAQAVFQFGELPAVEGLDNLYQGQLDNCCARDTLVQGPWGECRIDKLAEYGEPFEVWSVTPSGERVAATATSAFKKGSAELFEYVLEDGRSIKTTGEHRFLTDVGFLRGFDVREGTRLATVDHDSLPCRNLHVDPAQVMDSQYSGLSETDALKYRQVVGIRPMGVDDFYDMHVPGWENYSANGFWNHNTLLAWQRYTNPIRALFTGDLGYLERIERGSGVAYTISSILTLRAGDNKTRPFRGFKTQIRNAAPYVINYDILLDDRVGFEVDGILYVDQVSAIKYEYDRKRPITYTVSVGDDTRHDDPIAQGFRAIQAGASLLGGLVGQDTLFG